MTISGIATSGLVLHFINTLTFRARAGGHSMLCPKFPIVHLASKSKYIGRGRPRVKLPNKPNLHISQSISITWLAFQRRRRCRSDAKRVPQLPPREGASEPQLLACYGIIATDKPGARRSHETRRFRSERHHRWCRPRKCRTYRATRSRSRSCRRRSDGRPPSPARCKAGKP